MDATGVKMTTTVMANSQSSLHHAEMIVVEMNAVVTELNMLNVMMETIVIACDVKYRS